LSRARCLQVVVVSLLDGDLLVCSSSSFALPAHVPPPTHFPTPTQQVAEPCCSSPVVRWIKEHLQSHSSSTRLRVIMPCSSKDAGAPPSDARAGNAGAAAATVSTRAGAGAGMPSTDVSLGVLDDDEPESSSTRSAKRPRVEARSRSDRGACVCACECSALRSGLWAPLCGWAVRGLSAHCGQMMAWQPQ
jgi:hypothetical protein